MPSCFHPHPLGQKFSLAVWSGNPDTTEKCWTYSVFGRQTRTVQKKKAIMTFFIRVSEKHSLLLQPRFAWGKQWNQHYSRQVSEEIFCPFRCLFPFPATEMHEPNAQCPRNPLQPLITCYGQNTSQRFKRQDIFWQTMASHLRQV